MMSDPQPWSVRAQNLPEHARNPIHTDEGARAAGFERALVAGVTTFAYLTHPIAAAWGEAWLAGGSCEVRFRAPVCLDDEVLCAPEPDGDEWIVRAMVDGNERASLRASMTGRPVRSMREGDELRTRHIRMEGEFGDEYGSRAGDDLDLYRRRGVVHPAVWPAFANHLVHTEVADGSWIHTRSAIDHHGLAKVGDTADVSAKLVRRFDSRAGERVVLDVRIEVAGVPIASLEHEAIVAIR